MAPSSVVEASLRGRIGFGEMYQGDPWETIIRAEVRQLLLAMRRVHIPTLILIIGVCVLCLIASTRQQRISLSSTWILRRRRRRHWSSWDLSRSSKGAAGPDCLPTTSVRDTSGDLAVDMAREEKKKKPGSENRNPLRPQARRPTPHEGPSATAYLAQGRYTGVLLPASSTVPRAVEAWRGIPFAQTTGGQNRFRPPVPLDLSASSAADAHDASVFGPVCPGTASRIPGMLDGENCLNLNVYRPASYDPGRGHAAMPVVVYVHGGAFNGGLGTERDMSSFVGWSETPIVGVNFNYRVGALGFPSSSVAEQEGALNLGLRDQRLLFEWVRQNIGHFGGDASRVTLMGMSAGAHSVQIGYHLQSYTSQDAAPFHGAIMESGGATARATLSPSHPRTEEQFAEFLRAAGIEPTQTRADQIFPLLRSLPLETILYASSTVFSRYQDPIRWPFQPVIESPGAQDGAVTDLPINHFRRGSHLKIPVLAGFNTNEGTVFASPRVDTGDEFLGKFATMIPGLSGADLSALAKLYPDPVTNPTSPYANVPPGFGRQWARYEAAYSHYAYVCPVLQTGHFHSDHEESDGGGDDYPVWIYHFAALSRPDFGGKANHVDEAALVAHDMGAIGNFPGLVRTADAMHGAWTRFIATGDPNPAHIDDEAGQKDNSYSPSSTSSTPFWPRFSSPFVGDTARAPGRLRRKGRAGGEECGRVMMFGLGNDERMGGAGRGTPGVPATVVRMTEAEVEKCRFWWERVELSEGMGGRLARGAARSRL
ncbi:carboxylesterase 3 [Diaporthe amygdali]|uniref:carboxylesterase 3 n=1 Tax=Phomopsis amygdali TaxID=1214568 RepID=UPI0022FEE370|nr:carboxylesterase 3 [Diaporthe amygdali]KAJ0125131.1 carboxylesterase 3 [Diaporthe amygdali]